MTEIELLDWVDVVNDKGDYKINLFGKVHGIKLDLYLTIPLETISSIFTENQGNKDAICKELRNIFTLDSITVNNEQVSSVLPVSLVQEIYNDFIGKMAVFGLSDNNI